MIQKIIKILPKDKRVSLLKFGTRLLFLNILDLVSVAYLIPIITLILSKEKFIELLEKYNLNQDWFSNRNLIIILFIFLFFYIVKNSIQIKINKSLLNYLHALRSSIAVDRVKNFINSEYLQHKKQNRGELINVVMQATGHFCSKLLYPFMLLFSELILLVLLLIFSFYIHWEFMLLVFSIFLLFGLIIYFKKRMSIHKINDLFFSLHTQVSSILLDILNGVLDIKSSKSESFFIKSFKKYNQKLNKTTSIIEATGFNYSKYFEICLVITLTFMGLYFYNYSLNLLNISVLAAIAFKIIPSINKILNYTTLIKSHAYSADILLKYNVNKHSNTIEKLHFNHEILLEKVSFGFHPNELIFNEIDFSITPKDFIGIKGLTGVGKTTFLQIVMGLVNPQSGKIAVDSQEYHNHFLPFTSYVSQQPYLFNKSVLENITMGRKDVDYEYLDYLCEQLNLTSVIASLKEKYNTKVIHNDSFFSGGQKQRICIARALYCRPKLLILDEATNQQDSQLETSIFNFINDLSKKENFAVIAVSHNSNLETFYDKIYEIKEKKIVQINTKD